MVQSVSEVDLLENEDDMTPKDSDVSKLEVDVAEIKAKLDMMLRMLEEQNKLECRVEQIEKWAEISRDRWDAHGRLHAAIYGLLATEVGAIIYLAINLSVHMNIPLTPF